MGQPRHREVSNCPKHTARKGRARVPTQLVQLCRGPSRRSHNCLDPLWSLQISNLPNLANGDGETQRRPGMVRAGYRLRGAGTASECELRCPSTVWPWAVSGSLGLSAPHEVGDLTSILKHGCEDSRAFLQPLCPLFPACLPFQAATKLNSCMLPGGFLSCCGPTLLVAAGLAP